MLLRSYVTITFGVVMGLLPPTHYSITIALLGHTTQQRGSTKNL